MHNHKGGVIYYVTVQYYYICKMITIRYTSQFLLSYKYICQLNGGIVTVVSLLKIRLLEGKNSTIYSMI